MVLRLLDALSQRNHYKIIVQSSFKCWLARFLPKWFVSLGKKSETPTLKNEFSDSILKINSEV